MITLETIDTLMKACEQATHPRSHIPVILDVFLGLVDLSETPDEGFSIAASKLRGHTVDEPLALEAQSLKRLLEQAAENL